MSEWWVEEEGYAAETDRRQEAKLANRRMDALLTHLRVEYDPARYSEWQSVKCPFHGERRASASVHLQRNYFRCHACEIHGGPVWLVQHHERLSKDEAVKWILALKST